jgi:hypothetical protein
MNREMANSQFAVNMGAKVTRLEVENEAMREKLVECGAVIARLEERLVSEQVETAWLKAQVLSLRERLMQMKERLS